MNMENKLKLEKRRTLESSTTPSSAECRRAWTTSNCIKTSSATKGKRIWHLNNSKQCYQVRASKIKILKSRKTHKIQRNRKQKSCLFSLKIAPLISMKSQMRFKIRKLILKWRMRVRLKRNKRKNKMKSSKCLESKRSKETTSLPMTSWAEPSKLIPTHLRMARNKSGKKWLIHLPVLWSALSASKKCTRHGKMLAGMKWIIIKIAQMVKHFTSSRPTGSSKYPKFSLCKWIALNSKMPSHSSIVIR